MSHPDRLHTCARCRNGLSQKFCGIAWMLRAGMSVSKQPKNGNLKTQTQAPLPGNQGYCSSGASLVSLTGMVKLEQTIFHTTGTIDRSQGAHKDAGTIHFEAVKKFVVVCVHISRQSSPRWEACSHSSVNRSTFVGNLKTEFIVVATCTRLHSSAVSH